ncbi:MAG: GNAT family N-acetyltransferase [Burkholderiales bacterium]
MTTVSIGSWAEQRAAAQAIRYAVFVIEQNIPVALEWDELDDLCLHAVAHDEHGQCLGTGRLTPDGHIGRMAVKKSARGFGVGSAILNALSATAEQRGDLVIKLNAQTRAASFYAHHGFSSVGREFFEAGIPHLTMERVLREAT